MLKKLTTRGRARCPSTGSAACVPGSESPRGDLPGMPVAAPDAAACRAKCEADAGCSLYTYHEEGCSYGPPLAAGEPAIKGPIYSERAQRYIRS